MAGERPPGTITLEELQGLVSKPSPAKVTDQDVHEAAISALNGMRGMTIPTKRRVIRRMLKILSA